MMPGSMVGRRRELDELVQAWSQCVGGRRRTAVITGGAGVGKSMLVAAALTAFTPSPGTVLRGTARVHAPAPYDWLAAVLTGRRTDDVPVPADALAWLAQHPDAQRERYAPAALLRMAVRTVRALVGSGPAAVVVEDLHALDPASLNLVAELAAAPDLPALLVVTSRPPDDAVSPRLAARTLARLAGGPGGVRQHLRPLGRAEVGELVARHYPGVVVPADVVAAVHTRTRGNPYWLRELLATAAAEEPAALAGEPLPRHLGGAAGSTDADPDLTARERDVLSCLAEGMSNKQVARSLGISIRTVAVHVSNLLRKTRSASRTEVALWAARRRVGSPG
jgi:DNA-binding CsgD family transcriptional regulator